MNKGELRDTTRRPKERGDSGLNFRRCGRSPTPSTVFIQCSVNQAAAFSAFVKHDLHMLGGRSGVDMLPLHSLVAEIIAPVSRVFWFCDFCHGIGVYWSKRKSFVCFCFFSCINKLLSGANHVARGIFVRISFWFQKAFLPLMHSTVYSDSMNKDVQCLRLLVSISSNKMCDNSIDMFCLQCLMLGHISACLFRRTSMSSQDTRVKAPSLSQCTMSKMVI